MKGDRPFVGNALDLYSGGPWFWSQSGSDSPEGLLLLLLLLLFPQYLQAKAMTVPWNRPRLPHPHPNSSSVVILQSHSTQYNLSRRNVVVINLTVSQVVFEFDPGAGFHISSFEQNPRCNWDGWKQVDLYSVSLMIIRVLREGFIRSDLEDSWGGGTECFNKNWIWIYRFFYKRSNEDSYYSCEFPFKMICPLMWLAHKNPQGSAGRGDASEINNKPN
jgi:hypothetical protein